MPTPTTHPPSHGPGRAPHRSRSLDAYDEARTSYPAELEDHGNLAWLPDPADHLAETKLDISELTDQLRVDQGRVHAALAEPAVRSLPQELIQTERERWATDRQAMAQEERAASDSQDVAPSPTSGRQHERSAASYAPKAQPRDQPLNPKSRLRDDFHGSGR